MADVTIAAPGTVLPGSGVVLKKGTAGGTLTAGMPLYSDSGSIKAADADALASAACVGVAVCNAASGQPVSYQDSGTINLGEAVLTIGQPYVVSSTVGKTALFSDLAGGDYSTTVYTAVTTSTATIGIVASGVVKA